MRLRVDDVDEHISRFRNLGEDVYRALYGLATVDLEEVDASTDRFTVTNIRRRDLGKVAKLLRQSLRSNNYEADVDLIREDGRHV